MNEAEYLMKNYGDRGGRIMEIEDKLFGAVSYTHLTLPTKRIV